MKLEYLVKRCKSNLKVHHLHFICLTLKSRRKDNTAFSC